MNLYDPGLQPERTSLSWLRTSLALGVASAFVTRMTLERLGLIGITIGLLGLTFALAAAAVAGWRYRKFVRRLHLDGNLGTDGRVLALSSSSAIIIGLLAIGYVLNWMS